MQEPTVLPATSPQTGGNDLTRHSDTPGARSSDPGASCAKFVGETDTETNPDGSSYRSRYSFRVF